MTGESLPSGRTDSEAEWAYIGLAGILGRIEFDRKGRDTNARKLNEPITGKKASYQVEQTNWVSEGGNNTSISAEETLVSGEVTSVYLQEMDIAREKAEDDEGITLEINGEESEDFGRVLKMIEDINLILQGKEDEN